MPALQLRRFRKFDQDQQIVFGVVYAPDEVDSHGHFAVAETIQDTAYDFMKRVTLSKAIDTDHDGRSNGCYVVESFIARKGDPDFDQGAWVLGVKVPDKKLWKRIKNGELNGFSLDGFGTTDDAEVEVEVPTLATGCTKLAKSSEANGEEDHKHVFLLQFDENGKIVQGWTDVVNGHSHEILKASATEESDGHRHRFTF